MALLLENENDIFYIKLNRPEKRNAFNAELVAELTDAFKSASQSTSRLVCLSGAGESFCAGADLSWMKSMANFSEEENVQDAKLLFKLFATAKNCDLPVVAKVQGHVFGGALGLLSICDIVIAESETKFSFSEVRLGLAPATIAPFVLTKMSVSSAKEKMLTGRVFSAEEARDSGLVNFICKGPNRVQEKFDKIVYYLKSSGPRAVKKTKALLDKLSVNNWNEYERETTNLIASLRVSKEGQEGLSSFFNKTKPSWINED